MLFLVDRISFSWSYYHGCKMYVDKKSHSLEVLSKYVIWQRRKFWSGLNQLSDLGSYLFSQTDRTKVERILNSPTDIMKIRSYITYILTWTKLLCQDFQMCSTLNQNTHSKVYDTGNITLYAYMRKRKHTRKQRCMQKIKWENKRRK